MFEEKYFATHTRFFSFAVNFDKKVIVEYVLRVRALQSPYSPTSPFAGVRCTHLDRDHTGRETVLK